MVAGILSKAGYFMGENLIGPNDFNKKGNFESLDINNLNNQILHAHLTEEHLPRDLPRFAGWLYEIPPSHRVTSPTPYNSCIPACIKRTPFCFKDPRFSYTLPAWTPF